MEKKILDLSNPEQMDVFKKYVGAIAASLSEFNLENGKTQEEADNHLKTPHMRFLITELATCRVLIDHINHRLDTYMTLKI